MSEQRLAVQDASAFVVYMQNGSKIMLPPETLEKWTTDGPSWLRLAFTVMGGPPARMKLNLSGGKTDEIFVALQNHMPAGTTFDILDTRYPETWPRP